MIRIRRSAERGHADHGWLQTYHSFSFSQYHDPEHMRFGPLRVINEDFVAPARGFGMHPHEDMEIVTYIVSGQLEHQDSMGHRAVIERGQVQAMTAGKGILHAERNPSLEDSVHLYQIWIMPDEAGLEPRYADRRYDADLRPNEPLLLVTGGDEPDALHIHQDAKLYACRLEAGRSLPWDIAPGRKLWLQLVAGSLDLDGERLEAGDGVAVEDEGRLEVKAVGEAEVLVFDMG